ncbi:hypothetical protein EA462_02420 [Natrarchaeobius halalkaliphilus]|uniref:Uncharacterized protein n=1 Tax=Natrarchaeobius halalkaliphilus TaxID=1679091 RepID=A0A3N6M9U8_9EURY|nr:hypothetical protein EA462_02420 [Natrarchaeobius halalkaliphilus]
MPPVDFRQSQSDIDSGHPAIHCNECQSALQSDSQQAVSFLLLDQLTIPIVSCDDHLERFASVCGLTTEDTATLLDHRPAGGICCPGCRLARYNAAQPMVPVEEGAIVAMACPTHQTEIVQRFHTGLETQHHLSSDVSSL